MSAQTHTIIRQDTQTVECKSVRTASLLADMPCLTVAASDLERHAGLLRCGAGVPVGSVEYVRRAMQIACIHEPEWSSYPEPLQWMLRREVRMVRAGLVLGHQFLKPVRTKLFNGFVFHTMIDPSDLDEHDREQYAAFMALSPEEFVWTAEPTRFLCEWRYYICRGQLVGKARYDQAGESDAPLPHENDVVDAMRCMVDAFGKDVTCALDIGVIEGGETALVEATDAWALGLYGGGPSHRDYLDMLVTRWSQLAMTRSKNQC